MTFGYVAVKNITIFIKTDNTKTNMLNWQIDRMVKFQVRDRVLKAGTEDPLFPLLSISILSI